MLKPKFYATIKNGKIVFEDDEQRNFDIHLLKFAEGAEIEMTVAKKYKRRTQGAPGEETNFNGYLWAVVYKIIGDEIGEMDLNDIHYWSQINIGNVKGMPDGSVLPKGTSEMSGGEFAEYCSKVRMWANTPGNICDKGLFIPEPNECEYGRDY